VKKRERKNLGRASTLKAGDNKKRIMLRVVGKGNHEKENAKKDVSILVIQLNQKLFMR
jgi:hypothetical protein